MLNIITPDNEIDMFLPEVFYSDVYQFVDQCNIMIERNRKVLERLSTLNMHTMLLREKSADNVRADNVVTLSSELASIMGFQIGSSPLKMMEELKVAMDPNRAFNSIYVYCDAAEAIPMGDIKALLLRVVDAA